MGNEKRGFEDFGEAKEIEDKGKERRDIEEEIKEKRSRSFKDSQKEVSFKPKKPSISGKIILLIVLILFIWVLYYSKDIWVPLMQKSPILWALYNHISNQIDGRGLLGLAYLSFLSSLFFVFIPLEIPFIYYLSLEHNRFIVLGIVIICYTIGLVIDYSLGFVFGKGMLKWLFKGSYEKHERGVEKYGPFLIVIGYLFFFPMQIVTVFLGSARFPFKKFFVLSFIMLCVKFSLLMLGREYIISDVIPLVRSYLPFLF